MGVSMSTLTGWVIILALAGGYGYREWSNSQRAQLRQAASAQKTAKKVNKPKESKPKQATQGSDAKPKPKAKAPAPAPAPAAQTYNYSSDDLEADRDRDAARNREFARQLNNAKQGTTFAKKTKEETRQKSVKQSRAEEAPVVADTGKVSAPSSTAGIDADDDSSSAATSPVLAATQASAVDDMLEKSAPGPSVLRLTGTEEKPNYKTQKTKAPEVVETKKQRQNRKKAELAKAEREAAEVDRKSKLEAQRRAARQAEGRAAKDGSAFMAAQAAKSNAWTEAGNGKTASTGTNGFVPVQPLDTFDANTVQTAASKSSVPSYDKNEDWMSSLPSEEEQMEILRKDQSEDSWNTVTKSRKNKKNKESAAPAAEAPAAAAAPVAAKAAPVAAPAPVVQKQRPAAVASQSSFAALAVENPTEELQEEEWDV